MQAAGGGGWSVGIGGRMGNERGEGNGTAGGVNRAIDIQTECRRSIFSLPMARSLSFTTQAPAPLPGSSLSMHHPLHCAHSEACKPCDDASVHLVCTNACSLARREAGKPCSVNTFLALSDTSTAFRDVAGSSTRFTPANTAMVVRA